jgi:hypothetical protein
MRATSLPLATSHAERFIPALEVARYASSGPKTARAVGPTPEQAAIEGVMIIIPSQSLSIPTHSGRDWGRAPSLRV